MRQMIMHVTDPATGKVYPVPAGGSEDGDDQQQTDDDGGVEPDPDALGDAGKKALVQEREARKAAEREAKEAARKADRAEELEAELEQLREQQMSEQEKAIEKARKEAADEARNDVLSSVHRKLFTAEVRAAAASKVADPDLLSDPDVAMRLLEFDEVPVDAQGDVDTEAISAALDGLVERKPYLAVGDRQQVPGADQGARGGNGKAQLTREQLKNMTPEQLMEAEKDGRMDKLLGRT